MRPLRLVAAALLALAVPALAGDDPSDLARRYLSEDPAARAAAEAEVAKAPAEALRALLAEVRALRDGTHPADEVSFGTPETGRLVTLEVRFLEVETALARRWGLLDACGNARAGAVPPPCLACVRRAIACDPRVTQVTAPTVTVYDRQRATVSVAEQTAYVRDLDVTEGPAGSRVADPVVATVTTGIQLEMSPRIAPGDREVLVDADLRLSGLVRPLAEHALRLGGVEARIQCPEVRESRVQRRLVVPDGGTVVVAGFGNPGPAGPSRPGRQVVGLLTARVLGEGSLEPAIDFVPAPR